MDTSDMAAWAPPRRRIFCNRTLNLRSIRAIGYDMDYTLIHYRVEEWERRAYDRLRHRFLERGWPVGHLRFDPGFVTRGLILDVELGNVVKANRFGYVVKAYHGTRQLEFDEQRSTYSRTLVDLAEDRYVFLNTFFSLSEACMFSQLVDLLDEERLPQMLGYPALYRIVRTSLDEEHMEGELKERVVARPEGLVELDEDVPLALIDQRAAGKRLLLITNSDWTYTRGVMGYAIDRFMPPGQTWRDLFEVVLLSARKPDFFTRPMPLFEVVDENGLLAPCVGGIRKPGIYVGGDASQVERYLDVMGEEILFVGDHLFSDVHVAKNVLRWRTALIMRELEGELDAIDGFERQEEELSAMMRDKQRMEHALSLLRLQLQRSQSGYGPQPEAPADGLRERMRVLREELVELDGRIAPMAVAAGELYNRRWGLLMRAGNDKSHMARQVERFADIYTSRVSNFLHETPFSYFRAPRGTLPHDLTVLAGERTGEPEGMPEP